MLIGEVDCFELELFSLRNVLIFIMKNIKSRQFIRIRDVFVMWSQEIFARLVFFFVDREGL